MRESIKANPFAALTAGTGAHDPLSPAAGKKSRTETGGSFAASLLSAAPDPETDSLTTADLLTPPADQQLTTDSEDRTVLPEAIYPKAHNDRGPSHQDFANTLSAAGKYTTLRTGSPVDSETGQPTHDMTTKAHQSGRNEKPKTAADAPPSKAAHLAPARPTTVPNNVTAPGAEVVRKQAEAADSIVRDNSANPAPEPINSIAADATAQELTDQTISAKQTGSAQTVTISPETPESSAAVAQYSATESPADNARMTSAMPTDPAQTAPHEANRAASESAQEKPAARLTSGSQQTPPERLVATNQPSSPGNPTLDQGDSGASPGDTAEQALIAANPGTQVGTSPNKTRPAITETRDKPINKPAASKVPATANSTVESPVVSKAIMASAPEALSREVPAQKTIRRHSAAETSRRATVTKGNTPPTEVSFSTDTSIKKSESAKASLSSVDGIQQTALARDPHPEHVTGISQRTELPDHSIDTAMELPPIDQPLDPDNVSEAFRGALSERVISAVRQDMNRAEIRISPEELGPITIELSVDGDNASVVFSADQSGTRSALQESLQSLRDLLSHEGISLTEASVSDNTESQAGADERAGEHDERSQTNLKSADQSDIDDDQSRPYQVPLRQQGLVDLFA